MFMITNLIESCIGKLILHHLFENKCPEFRSGLLLYLWTDSYFWYFIIVKICVNFSIIGFYFNFWMFFVVYRITTKFFSIFNKFCYIFLNNSSFFIKKDIHSVSSKSLLYALNFGRNIY